LAGIHRQTWSAPLLERDIENSYLAADTVDEDPMDTLLRHSMTYRIAVGPQAGREGVYAANLAGQRSRGSVR